MLAIAFGGRALADDTIKVAYTDPLSGPFAQVGDANLKQMQYIIDYINAKGGALGKKFELVPFDNKSQPSDALIALKSATDQNMPFIMQCSGSNIAAALIDGVNKHNDRNPDNRIIYLNCGAVAPELTNEQCSFWHFRFDLHAGMKAEVMVRALPSHSRFPAASTSWAMAASYSRERRPSLPPTPLFARSGWRFSSRGEVDRTKRSGWAIKARQAKARSNVRVVGAAAISHNGKDPTKEIIQMLASQRALFEIPRHICFLNAASYSPLPLRTLEAGRAAVGRKGTPWMLEAGFANQQHERARTAAARLINAEPSDIALIPSISYGVATAAKLLTPGRGTRVVVLENDHSSPVLEWQMRAESQGFTVETVRQPDGGDWTSAVLEAIERPGAPPVSLASISSVHWSDGGLIDVVKVGAALRQQGAAFVIDATQSAGVLAMDVQRLDPDFVIFPTYKWLLGPYGRAFLYVSKRHQNGIPLEQTASGRRNVRAENAVYFTDLSYVPDARRFDMGERDHFISLEMASIGMEMMVEWGATAVVQRLAMLTERIAEGVRGLGVGVLEPRLRAPHILSLAFKDGMPAGLVEELASDGVYVAPRLGRMRISPHVYNDEADADRFVEILTRRFA